MADDEQIPADGKDKSGGALGGLVQAESMLQIALSVPAGCVVGLLIGTWLDHHFHTKWIVVLLMLLGAAGGFVQIFTVGLRGTGPGRGSGSSRGPKGGE